MEKTKKYLNYLFINVGQSATEWARIGKSVEWTDSMNPQVDTFDYIEDSAPTSELAHYNPSTSMPLTAYVGDPVYDFVFDLYRTQAVGSNAVTQALRVYQQKQGNANVATLTDVLVTIDNYNIATGVITFTLAQRGTPTQGSAEIEDGVVMFS
ncbi:MAG: hypothetical protein FWE06_07950 [Oscillospiraceae bacterium]|nr:hypothetical protein [Oscillospiraceae bacterium]